MLIFAELTWNAPDVVVVYSFQCHSYVLESIQDSNFSLGIQIEVRIIWLHCSVAIWTFTFHKKLGCV